MSTPRDRWLVVTYAVAIFVSAFLLFHIQPLVSKRILPWFGGSTSVWTTCLLFFQSSLFAGYAYAHWSNTWLRPRQQAAVHIALIIVALALLPALPGDRWEPTGSEPPIGQILLILTVSIGVPYFVLASTGPLLQAWFARSFSGHVPYRLYALSNVGSLLALLSFPFFFEPMFNVQTQARLWAGGFIVYAALCAYIAWRIGSVPAPRPEDARAKSKSRKTKATVLSESIDPPLEQVRPRIGDYPFWLLSAAFGSLVLVATTNHISTDIASMPLLWIVPLSLYLLTYIIAFDRPTWYRRVPFALLAIVSIYLAAMTHFSKVGDTDLSLLKTTNWLYVYFTKKDPSSTTFSDLSSTKFNISTLKFLCVNFAALFAICMICHGELVRRRPSPRYLTSFYLMIAAGGALGGILATLIAPLVLKSYYEWDAALVVATVASVGLLVYSSIGLVTGARARAHRPLRYGVLCLALLAQLVLSIMLMIDLSQFLFSPGDNVRWRARNFFGALTVEEREPDDEETQHFVLVHGSITHGSQFALESRRREPTTYYAHESGVGRAIEYFQKHLPPGKFRIGAVGLGAGTLAAYPNAGESITFYEINPNDIDIAENHSWFTYLRDCRERGARCDIHLGDARLSLRRELQKNERPPYHLIVLDAFSGDSIPVHLLTSEAFETYLASITSSATSAGQPDEAGAIAVHISNRYLDLEPVVRAIVLRYGLLPLNIDSDDDDENNVYTADWMILTHNKAIAIELAQYASNVDTTKPPVLWTDDRSSLFEILR